MRRSIAFVTAVSFLAPAAVFALDLTDSANRYSDASRFSTADRAGISVLTNMGVVQGNPNGAFAAGRTLNRAEFVKIAMSLKGGVSSAGMRDGQPCFPDVPDSAWFSPYVCSAAAQGVVQGNPDGLFHPDRNVNYAEALKILVETYDYDMPESRGEWYRPYADAAESRDVLLTEKLGYGAFLTRGQMARLAAAFQAESEGELDAYRAAERGEMPTSSEPASSSDSSDSSVSSVSSPAPSSSASSSVSSAASSLFPSRNRFLLVGQTVWPVLDGTFTADEEELTPSVSDIILRREIRSIDRMWLIDASGNEIMEYLLSTTDTEKRRWKAQTTSSAFRMAKGSSAVLGVKVKLKERSMGGSSNELFEVERFSVDFVGAATGMNRQLVPTAQHYPQHLTAQAELKSVRNAMDASGTFQAGLRKVIGAFTFSGTVVPGAELRLSEIDLRIEKTGVSLGRVRIGSTAEVEQADCAVDGADGSRYSCSLIPETVDDVVGGGRTLWVVADVTVTGTQGTLRVSLPDAGALGRNGSVRWTDGTGRFNWMDAASPLAIGTEWTVIK